MIMLPYVYAKPLWIKLFNYFCVVKNWILDKWKSGSVKKTPQAAAEIISIFQLSPVLSVLYQV